MSVWYAKVTPTFGAGLRLGDWLDSLDHSGARKIFGLSMDRRTPDLRTVKFFGSRSGELIRADVEYPVVDPASRITDWMIIDAVVHRADCTGPIRQGSMVPYLPDGELSAEAMSEAGLTECTACRPLSGHIPAGGSL